MRLDRNKNLDGQGKYMLFLTRKFTEQYAPGSILDPETEVQKAATLLLDEGLIEDPGPGTQQEFFVLRLKDRHSRAALSAYAESVRQSDPEFAAEVDELAARAGPFSPWCKEPD